MSDVGTTQSTIDVTTKMFPLAFLLLFFKTNIFIDGELNVAQWGHSRYEVVPGHHEIEIGFRYFFSRNMGSRKVTVQIDEGKTVTVTYRSPFLVNMPGSITIR